ncbi:hypothetical protein K469DRAFT_706530 [Zopfia rhizophila CBS 207.26]|uniref:DUF7165 domain-containing protein n=1 Tax=Zopfia rhizophila CBS 207.26 TaxID=1314779 RepID=A0A6A6E8Q6_9PEZI|nr:hypothetical protein K469DRAFT_706530 [Zopfia rhizophila CBS 207.26]
MSRRRTLQDDGKFLAIRTDLRGKGVANDDELDRRVGGGDRLSRGSSANSIASTSAGENNTYNTTLSASSTGMTDTLSSSDFSASSTARSSAMTEDDRPSASNATAPPKYSHPTITILELVSNTASSSALGDCFGFNVSRKGNFIAVYTASNIWLIKASQLPRLWARTLEVKRKPVAIDILESGFLLAVLSRPSQVDLYEIHGEQDRQIRKRRTIMLVHEASSIVLSPDGLVLITGNKYGIEVVAIGPEAPETCRRTLSGPVGDTLEFSDDGRTLLITGYARKSGTSSMYVLPGLYDGPLNEEGVPVPQSPVAVWTGLVLFPETARIARQATLLPDSDTGQVNELFAFNANEDSWGIYDIASARFTQRKMFLPDQQRWTRSEFIDDAMPAVSPNADLAAVALRIRGTTSIWIYQVPEWDYKPGPHDPEHQSPIHPCFRVPILQDSTDGHQEISTLRWVKIGAHVQRLIAVGNMSSAQGESDVPSIPQGSKGVVAVLDFDSTRPLGGEAPVPTKTDYDLDILLPGERLPEENIDFEREVELVRTRTIAQRRAQDRTREGRRSSRGGSTPSRARTSSSRERAVVSRASNIPTIVRDDEEELTGEEAIAAFEAPYDHSQPRSQVSLARAATVAAVSPANRRHLRALPFRPLEYRRADGLREFPHESDADNWVPPPPAYTATAEASHSVSLSHPNAPPTQASVNEPSTSAIPPVPPLPASVNPSQLMPGHPYPSIPNHGSMQTQSTTDLTLPAPLPRPSLVHPSTFPSPQSPVGRRGSASTPRGSVSQTPLFRHPPSTAPSQTSNQRLSAYQATSHHPTRRPTLRGRQTVESTVDLRPPPMVNPNIGRRGSAPDTNIHRRAVPVSASANRASVPNPQSQRRGLLPRLSTLGTGPVSTGRTPRSAPPRANAGGDMSLSNIRSGAQERPKSTGKKKLGCLVM